MPFNLIEDRNWDVAGYGFGSKYTGMTVNSLNSRMKVQARIRIPMGEGVPLRASRIFTSQDPTRSQVIKSTEVPMSHRYPTFTTLPFPNFTHRVVEPVIVPQQRIPDLPRFKDLIRFNFEKKGLELDNDALELIYAYFIGSFTDTLSWTTFYSRHRSGANALPIHSLIPGSLPAFTSVYRAWNLFRRLEAEYTSTEIAPYVKVMPPYKSEQIPTEDTAEYFHAARNVCQNITNRMELGMGAEIIRDQMKVQEWRDKFTQIKKREDEARQRQIRNESFLNGAKILEIEKERREKTHPNLKDIMAHRSITPSDTFKLKHLYVAMLNTRTSQRVR